MLTAILKNGNTICLSDRKDPSTLYSLREKEVFFCPECKEKLILKIGLQKIPHFAHYRVTNCSRYENESGYHLAGKERIYLWLKEMGLCPELEPYDDSIRKRPDISFIYQGIKVAVEFQCSNIPESLIKKDKRLSTKSILSLMDLRW